MKRLAFLLLIAFGLYELADHVTEGFTIARIAGELPAGKNDPLDPTLFRQRYTYLAKGSQSYAFVSEDGRYVLKFFREHKWRKKKEGRDATMQSCRFAAANLAKETGLIGLHLCQSRGLGTVTIIDKNHIAHPIDLDKTAFVIQHFAEPAGARLLRYKAAGDLQNSRTAIDALLSHITNRFATGLSDKDPHPIRNFGFLGDRAIEVDIGGFVRDPVKDSHYLYTEELEIVRKKIGKWLKNHFPEMVSYANIRIDESKRSALGSQERNAPPSESGLPSHP